MAKKTKKEKKVKEPRVKKPKKKKEKVDGGGFQVFLANHVEKVVFVVAALLCLTLVMSGFKNREGIDSAKTPAALDQEIATVSRKVDDFNWQRDYADILKKDQKDFPERADQALKQLESDAYVNNQYLRPPISPPRTKRTDPDLFAALSLQVRSGSGILRKEMMRERRGEMAETEQEIDFGDQPIDEELGDGTRQIPNQRGGREGRSRRTNDGKGVFFVSVTALVPVRQQLAEYQKRLLHSRGSDPQRDTPTYVNWRLERAKVSGTGETGKFQRVALFSRLPNRNQTVGGRESRFMRDQPGADSFDPKYSDPVLTSSVPNIEVRDAEALFVHDRIAEFSREKEKRQPGTPREATQGDPSIDSDDNEMWGPADERTGPMRREGGPERRREGRGGGGQRPMEGGGVYRQGQLAGDTPLDKTPEFYMFRFVDTKVTPGERYKYRLKLVIEDPNAPNDGNDPDPETLEASVAERLAPVKVPANRTFFGRIGDYSAESPVVRVRRGQTVLAGDVQPASRVVVRSTGQVFNRPGSEPVAKVMALKFDYDRATEIPGEVDVRPGSVVDFRQEVEVPLYSLGVLKKEKHHFQFDTVVLDIRGGEEEKIELLSRPGELLIWDETGQVSVINQLDGAELYAENTFEPEQRSARDGRPGMEGDGDGRGREGRGREGGRGDGDGRRSRRGPG